MKKNFILVALCLMNVALIAQEDYELRTLTFEDADYRGTASNAATYWSDLVPASAYGNGNGHDTWWDEGNTELTYTPSSTALFPGYGGHALSNYVGNDLSLGYYMYDLQAYNVAGGVNGSNNFCVHFGYLDDSGMGMMSELVYFTFADGVERTIDHMYVTNTTYVFNLLENGDGWMIPSGGVSDNCWYKIIAYGYNLANQLTDTAEFVLWEHGKGIQEWTPWDLSVLGNVARVEFNLVGSDELYASGYGLGAPGYFAYDNVAVRFPHNSTSLPNPHSPLPRTNSQKILRNGQLFILREGRYYTITGQEIQ